MPGGRHATNEPIDQQVLLQGHKAPATYPKWRQMESETSQQPKHQKSNERASKSGGSGGHGKVEKFSNFRQNEPANAGEQLPSLTAALDLDAMSSSMAPASMIVKDLGDGGTIVLEAPIDLEETPEKMIKRFMKQNQAKQRSSSHPQNSVALHAPVQLEESRVKVVERFMHKKEKDKKAAAKGTTKDKGTASRGTIDTADTSIIETSGTSSPNSKHTFGSPPPSGTSSPNEKSRAGEVISSLKQRGDRVNKQQQQNLAQSNGAPQTSLVTVVEQRSPTKDEGGGPWWQRKDSNKTASNIARSRESRQGRSRSPSPEGAADPPARARSRNNSPEVIPVRSSPAAPSSPPLRTSLAADPGWGSASAATGPSSLRKSSTEAVHYEGSIPSVSPPQSTGDLHTLSASLSTTLGTTHSTTRAPLGFKSAATTSPVAAAKEAHEDPADWRSSLRNVGSVGALRDKFNEQGQPPSPARPFSPAKQPAQTPQASSNTQPPRSPSPANPQSSRAASSPRGDGEQNEFARTASSLRKVPRKPHVEPVPGHIQAYRPEFPGENTTPEFIGKQLKPTSSGSLWPVTSDKPPSVPPSPPRSHRPPLRPASPSARALVEGVSFFAGAQPPAHDSRQQAASADAEAYKVVKVTVQKALHLPKADTFGSIDPFCELHVGSQVEKTKVIKNNYAPDWNQTLTFNHVTSGERMVLKVWDWDRFSKNDLVGEVVVPLDGRNIEQAFPLMLHGAAVKGKDKENAQVFLMLDYTTEMAGKHAVEAVRAREVADKVMEVSSTEVLVTSVAHEHVANKDTPIGISEQEQEKQSVNNEPGSGEKVMSVKDRMQQLAGGGMQVERVPSFGKRASTSPGGRRGVEQQHSSLFQSANEVAPLADDAHAQHQSIKSPTQSVKSPPSSQRQVNISAMPLRSEEALPPERVPDTSAGAPTPPASLPLKPADRAEVDHAQAARTPDQAEDPPQEPVMPTDQVHTNESALAPTIVAMSEPNTSVLIARAPSQTTSLQLRIDPGQGHSAPYRSVSRGDSGHSVLLQPNSAPSGLFSPSHSAPSGLFSPFESTGSARLRAPSSSESLYVVSIEQSPPYPAKTIEPPKLSLARIDAPKFQSLDSIRYEDLRDGNFSQVENPAFLPSLSLSDPDTPLGLKGLYKKTPLDVKEDTGPEEEDETVSPPYGLVRYEDAERRRQLDSGRELAASRDSLGAESEQQNRGGVCFEGASFMPVELNKGSRGVRGVVSWVAPPVSIWESGSGKTKSKRDIDLRGVEEERSDSMNESSRTQEGDGEGSEDDRLVDSVSSDHAHMHPRMHRMPAGATNTNSTVVSLGPLTVEIDATVGVTNAQTRTVPMSSRRLSQRLLVQGNSIKADSADCNSNSDSPNRTPRVVHPSPRSSVNENSLKEALMARVSSLEKNVLSLSTQLEAKDSKIAEDTRKLAALSELAISQQQLVEDRDTRVAELVNAMAKAQHEWHDELSLQRKEHQHAMSQALHEHTEELTKLQKLSADEIARTLEELVLARNLEAQATKMAAEYASEASASRERSALLERSVDESRQSMQAQLHAARQSEIALRMKLVEVEDMAMRARQEATQARTELDQNVAATVQRQLIAAQLEDALQEEIVELRKEGALLRAQRDSLATEVRDYTAAMSELREQVERLEREVRKAQMDRAAMKDALELVERRHEQDIVERNVRLDHAMLRAAEKENEFVELREKEDGIRREADELKSRLHMEGETAERECERACTAEDRLREVLDGVVSRGSEMRVLAELCTEDTRKLLDSLQELEHEREKACERWKAESERAMLAEARAADLEQLTAGILEECASGLKDSRARARECEDTLLEMQRIDQANSEQAMQERLEKEALQSRIKALEHYLVTASQQSSLSLSQSLHQQLRSSQPQMDHILPGARVLEANDDDLESISSLNSQRSVGDDHSQKMLQFLEGGRAMLAKFVGSAQELDSANAGLQHKMGILTAQLERLDAQRKEGHALSTVLQATKATLRSASAANAVASPGCLALKSVDVTGEREGKNMVWLQTALHTTQAALHKEQMRCVELEGRVAVLMGEKGALEVQLKVAEKLLAGLSARDGLGTRGGVEEERDGSGRGEHGLGLDAVMWGRDERLRALEQQNGRLMDALRSAEDERDHAKAKIRELQAVLVQQEDMEGRLTELEQESRRLRREKEECEGTVGTGTPLHASDRHSESKSAAKRSNPPPYTAPMLSEARYAALNAATREIPESPGISASWMDHVEVGSGQRVRIGRGLSELYEDGMSDAARRAIEIRNNLKLLNTPSPGGPSPSKSTSSLRKKHPVTAVRLADQKRGAFGEF